MIEPIGSIVFKYWGIRLVGREMKESLVDTPLAFRNHRSICEDRLNQGRMQNISRLITIDHDVVGLRIGNDKITIVAKNPLYIGPLQ